MSSKSFQQIQQIGDDDKVIDCSCCAKVKSNLLKSQVIGELDDFSFNIKFLNNGEQSFKTLFSGISYLILLLAAITITYFFALPSTLNTTITQSTFFTQNEPQGSSIFDHIEQPFSYSIVPNSPVSFPPQFNIRVYYVQKNVDKYIITQLQFDKNCKNGNYCLTKNVNKDKNLQIYGNSSDIISGKIIIELIWCNSTTGVPCTSLNLFAQTFFFENTIKQREKIVVPTTSMYQMTTTIFIPSKLFTFDVEVIRQNYISNSKFWGHIANILPQTIKTYYISTAPLTNSTTFDRAISSKKTSNQYVALAITFKSTGKTSEIRQNFFNILNPIIFLLALMDPLTWLLKNLFLNNYNRNCRDLLLADKLYYIEDKKHHEKFNFSSGLSIFFICFFYRNPIFILFEKIIKLFGKNLVDILPIKSIHTISMINQGTQVMSENVFFGTIEQFTNLEEGEAKKTVLDRYQLEDQSIQDEDEQQLQYFIDQPIQKLAFDRFCADNNYISGKRKNKAYHILLDKKYSTSMKDGFHKEFDSYIRNINRLKKEGKVLELIGDNNIPVDLVQRDEETNVGLRND